MGTGTYKGQAVLLADVENSAYVSANESLDLSDFTDWGVFSPYQLAGVATCRHFHVHILSVLIKTDFLIFSL